MNSLIFVFIALSIFIRVISMEFFAVSSAISALSAIIYNNNKVSCYFSECCNTESKWLPMDIKKLENWLNSDLHGQHLVKLVLLKQLKFHIFSNNPNKALLFSFNGMPGTGKNFVSTLIAESLYLNGMKSKYVHLFLPIHFPLEQDVEKNKVKLQQKIMESVKLCRFSLFIFDEVHDFPGNLLDAIKPFVDNYESIDGVDYRKAIFILLSNSGGQDINSRVVEVHKSGRGRESITLKEMEDALAQNLFKMNKDGLRKSKLISHNLITAFIPFLPLEKEHVVLCIKNLLRKKMLEIIINNVIDTLNFHSTEGLHLSVQGCKRLEDKLQLFL